VRVRRSRRSHKIWLSAIGFLIDASVTAMFIKTKNAEGSSALELPALATGIGLFWEGMDIYFDSTVAHEDEQVIPRTIDLTARWDGLADVRVKLVLPATRAATLRLPRTYTFDEALTLWARENKPPLTEEGLYRISSYYRIRALQGVHGARERAIEHFKLYLQRHAAAEHADGVRRALEEFRRLEERER